MPTRKPNKARRPARGVRRGLPGRSTPSGGPNTKHARVTSTTARAGMHTVTRKPGAAIAHAVTTVRKGLVGAATSAVKGTVTWAVHRAMTAVTPEAAPAGTTSPQKSGEEPDGEPGYREETDHERLHPVQDQPWGHLVASERHHRRRSGDDPHDRDAPCRWQGLQGRWLAQGRPRRAGREL